MKNKRKKNGYALIYALLFIILLMLTVSATLMTSMVDIKLQRRTENSNYSYSLARMAIENGWEIYKSRRGTNYTIQNVTYPTGTCSVDPSVSMVIRVDPNINPPEVSSAICRTNSLLMDRKNSGIYDFKIYTDGTLTTTIWGIGYYKGNMTSLRGLVIHNDIILEDLVGNPVGRDHSLDTIEIMNTGPIK